MQPTRFKHAHKYMIGHKDKHVAVVKNTLDGTNIFTLMKYRNKGHTHE